MSGPRPTRIVGDLSDLPTGVMGARNAVWWGNLGFMLIEGTAFALAIGAYLYLQSQSRAWPPAGDAPPDLFWATLFTVALIASELPNRWVSRKTWQRNAPGVRIGTLLMVALGFVLLAIRGFELAHLNVRWDHDAYGSIVWMLMVLHTSHLVTELGDIGVQSLWLHTHKIEEDQFADVGDSSAYWSFVILAWLPLYVLIYWVPRWL
jgi:cytochrome c oxidase subunit 3